MNMCSLSSSYSYYYYKPNAKYASCQKNTCMCRKMNFKNILNLTGKHIFVRYIRIQQLLLHSYRHYMAKYRFQF